MSGVLNCRMCGAPLAIDQRYCVECGTRARALPAWLRIGGVREAAAAQAATEPAPAAVDHGPIRIGPLTLPRRLPSPRAAAVAVLATLGFGVAVGAAGLSVADAPIQVLLGVGGGTSTPQLASSVAPTSAGSGSHVITVVETVGGGGSGGSGAGAAATPSENTSTATTTSTTTTTTATTPPIKHVWAIVLGDQGYDQTFAPTSTDSYLSKTLASKGEVVPAYYATSQSDLANEVAMLSGQGPTEDMLDNCPQFSLLQPATTASSYGQVIGQGCVFSQRTPTLFTELDIASDSYRSYVQGLGTAAAALPTTPTTTSTPAPTTTSTTTPSGSTPDGTGDPLGGAAPLSPDAEAELRADSPSTLPELDATTPTQRPHVASDLAASCRYPTLGDTDAYNSVGDSSGYVTWRNPAVYFESFTSSASCGSDDVGIGQLASDLKSTGKTPNVSFIYADPCDDGSDTPCTTGAPSGTAQSDSFLQQIVPEIMASPAYKANGMILITFAEAPQSGSASDASQASCCDTQTYPNITTTTTTSTPAPPSTTTTTTTTGTGTTTTGAQCVNGVDANDNPCIGGGGQVGLLVLSKYVTRGSIDAYNEFNHFSLLLSIEKLFDLPELGYAQDTNLQSFSGNVFFGNLNAGS